MSLTPPPVDAFNSDQCECRVHCRQMLALPPTFVCRFHTAVEVHHSGRVCVGATLDDTSDLQGSAPSSGIPVRELSEWWTDRREFRSSSTDRIGVCVCPMIPCWVVLPSRFVLNAVKYRLTCFKSWMVYRWTLSVYWFIHTEQQECNIERVASTTQTNVNAVSFRKPACCIQHCGVVYVY